MRASLEQGLVRPGLAVMGNGNWDRGLMRLGWSGQVGWGHVGQWDLGSGMWDLDRIGLLDGLAHLMMTVTGFSNVVTLSSFVDGRLSKLGREAGTCDRERKREREREGGR